MKLGAAPLAIDVHAHALVPRAEALLAGNPGLTTARELDARHFGTAATEVNLAQLARLGPLLTNVDRRLKAMDAARVHVQLVAPIPTAHAWADHGLAAAHVEATNQGIADLVGAKPDRLIGIGTVALQHPELALQQLVRATIELDLRGVQISTRAGERELDDPALADFWRRAEELQAMVIIHPWGCTLGTRLADFYLANTIGNPVETTVALSRMIFSGLLDRHPELVLVAVHGGGYLPTYLGRSDHAWQERPDAHLCAQPPSSYLRRIWFDSLVYSPSALRALVDAVGSERVLLGSDYPFDMGVTDPVDRLEASGLEAEVIAGIAFENATRLLARTTTSHGLLKSRDRTGQ